MANAPAAYRPLGGRGRDWFAVALAVSYRLYLGEDHLLYVANQRFTESYKRFYFRDIQALVLTRTRYQMQLNLVIAGLAFTFALLSWAIGSGFGAVVGLDWLAGLLGFCLVLLLVNLARGPSCRCHLKTAVQTYELASLKRIRTAQSVFARIQPLIEAAQGVLTQEEIQAGAAAVQSEPARGAGLPGVTLADVLRRHDAGTWHLVLAATLLLDSAFTTLDMLSDQLVVSVAGVFVTVGVVAALIMAFIRQHQSDLGPGLRRFAWGALAYLAIMMLWGQLYGIAEGVQNPDTARTQWEMLRDHAQRSAFESPLLLAGYGFSLFCSTVLGVTGLLLVLRHRQAAAVTTPPPEVQDHPAAVQPGP